MANPTLYRKFMLDAAALAVTTADAYSFSYFGPAAWRACCLLLLRRGYNFVEVDALLRSKLTRLAADGRRSANGHATSHDLARFLDSFDGLELRDVVDDYVLGINLEEMAAHGALSLIADPALEPYRARNRHELPPFPPLRLVWSRL